MIRSVAFNDLTSSEIAEARARLGEVTLTEAQRFAAHRMLKGPAAGSGLSAEDAASALALRDPSDPHYQNLCYFEKPWSLLVLQLATEVLADPSPAVRAARERGVTVAEIAAALGISENGVYKRYGQDVVRRPRKA